VHHDRCLLSCNLGRYGPIATRIELNHNVAAAKQHQKKSENKYHPELVFFREQTSIFVEKNLDRILHIITKLLILQKIADLLWQKETVTRKET